MVRMKLGSPKAGQKSGGSVFANFAWLMFDRLGRMIINFVVGVAVARHLGPADFGVLSYATASASIFAVFAGLGLDELLVRDLVRESEAGATWRAAWQLRLAAALVAFGGVVVMTVLGRPDAPQLWGVVAIVAVGLLFTPVDLVDSWFLAQSRMRPPAMARQAALWIAAAWRLVLVAVGAGLLAFAFAILIESALVGAALLWVLRRSKGPIPSTASVATERRRLLTEGWPLMVSGLLVTVTMQADRLLLGRFCGDMAVGTYAVAARLTEVCYALPLALGAAVMPRLAVLYREETAEYWRLARRAFFGLGLVGLVGSGLASALAAVLVPLIFGARYADSARILAVHVWVLAFVFMVSMRSRMLVIEAGTRWVLSMSLLTALLNVGTNILLIPRHGAMGAAVAAVAAWAFSALVAPWFFAATRRLNRNLLGLVAPAQRPA